MPNKENPPPISIPPNYEINWSAVKWPNFTFDPRTPDRLVTDWLKNELLNNPQLLIPKSIASRRPVPGDPFK